MVRQIPLSRGLVALVDDEDYERVIAVGSWHADPADYKHLERNRFYAKHTTSAGKGRKIYLHRFILGVEGGIFIDHRNGDSLDCRRSNLRIATRSQNCVNRKNGSKIHPFKGIDRHPESGRWRARVRVNGVRYYSGWHESAEEAAREYDRLARVHHGDFARLNFPEVGELAA